MNKAVIQSFTSQIYVRNSRKQLKFGMSSIQNNTYITTIKNLAYFVHVSLRVLLTGLVIYSMISSIAVSWHQYTNINPTYRIQING